MVRVHSANRCRMELRLALGDPVHVRCGRSGLLPESDEGNWNLLIYMMAVVAAFGAVFWLFIDPITPIEET